MILLYKISVKFGTKFEFFFYIIEIESSALRGELMFRDAIGNIKWLDLGFPRANYPLCHFYL